MCRTLAIGYIVYTDHEYIKKHTFFPSLRKLYDDEKNDPY